MICFVSQPPALIAASRSSSSLRRAGHPATGRTWRKIVICTLGSICIANSLDKHDCGVLPQLTVLACHGILDHLRRFQKLQNLVDAHPRTKQKAKPSVVLELDCIFPPSLSSWPDTLTPLIYVHHSNLSFVWQFPPDLSRIRSICTVFAHPFGQLEQFHLSHGNGTWHHVVHWTLNRVTNTSNIMLKRILRWIVSVAQQHHKTTLRWFSQQPGRNTVEPSPLNRLNLTPECWNPLNPQMSTPQVQSPSNPTMTSSSPELSRNLLEPCGVFSSSRTLHFTNPKPLQNTAEVWPTSETSL